MISSPEVSDSRQCEQRIRFLLDCCQAYISEDGLARIRLFVHEQLSRRLTGDNPDEGIGMNELSQLAHAHGVFPLVYKVLATHAADLIPPKSFSQLKQQYVFIVQNNLRLTAELKRVVALLANNDIRAMAYKGPVLSQMAYGDFASRQYVDLDILVDTCKLAAAGEVLMQNGFEPVYPASLLESRTYLNAAKDFSFLSKNGQVHTELHWRLFEKKLNQFTNPWRSGVEPKMVELNRQLIPTLEVEPLLVYLCYHGSKHAWERIEWICDIDRLIRSQSPDWEIVCNMAKQTQSRKTLLLGLALAVRYFSTPISKTLKKQTEIRQIAQLLSTSEKLINESVTMDSAYKRNWRLFLFQLRIFESIVGSVRFVLATLFAVSPEDCRAYPLPDKFKFLYLILRPYRLVKSYSLSFRRTP